MTNSTWGEVKLEQIAAGRSREASQYSFFFGGTSAKGFERNEMWLVSVLHGHEKVSPSSFCNVHV